jgi:Domain of unknown function (DUF4328)
MTDIWVCSNCHSVNRQRASRCYKCSAPQTEAASGEMATVRQEQAIAVRSVIGYRPATALGLGAAIFLAAFAAFNLVTIPIEVDLARFLSGQLDVLKAGGGMDRTAIQAHIDAADRIGLIGIAVIVPGLVLFAAWLSRVVSNVPALGGGIPGTTPYRAFVNTLIPVVNLRTVPGTINDVLYRLDPKAGGIFMVGVAWAGIVGSYIVGFIASRYLTLRMTFDVRNATSLDEAIDELRGDFTAAVIIDVATSVLIAIGAIVLVMIMVRIERRSGARDREVRAVAGV